MPKSSPNTCGDVRKTLAEELKDANTINSSARCAHDQEITYLKPRNLTDTIRKLSPDRDMEVSPHRRDEHLRPSFDSYLSPHDTDSEGHRSDPESPESPPCEKGCVNQAVPHIFGERARCAKAVKSAKRDRQSESFAESMERELDEEWAEVERKSFDNGKEENNLYGNLLRQTIINAVELGEIPLEDVFNTHLTMGSIRDFFAKHKGCLESQLPVTNVTNLSDDILQIEFIYARFHFKVRGVEEERETRKAKEEKDLKKAFFLFKERSLLETDRKKIMNHICEILKPDTKVIPKNDEIVPAPAEPSLGADKKSTGSQQGKKSGSRPQLRVDLDTWFSKSDLEIHLDSAAEELNFTLPMLNMNSGGPKPCEAENGLTRSSEEEARCSPPAYTVQKVSKNRGRPRRRFFKSRKDRTRLTDEMSAVGIDDRRPSSKKQAGSLPATRPQGSGREKKKAYAKKFRSDSPAKKQKGVDGEVYATKERVDSV
ncbi:uncharacterized protein RAG0_08535 [Rhynchosporium agropyri]|uniref:Uncharacterized protein n=1 Tax=Rhynchosporium agropyri TaxID=914238 RepID=A0A1E1KR89_9HELO|nr:uncharacterized protein RAG0_08535 [Rhynchosporium agropyri]